MKYLIAFSFLIAPFAHASLRVNNSALAGTVLSYSITPGMMTLNLSSGAQMQIGTVGLRNMGVSAKEFSDLLSSAAKNEIDLNVIAPTASHSNMTQVTGLTIVRH